MYPSLFGINSLHSYGLFVGVAIVASMYVAQKLGRQSGLKEKHLNRLFIIVMIMSIVGGRLLYVAQNYKDFSNNLSDIFFINQGGMVIYGALIFGVGSCVLYARARKMPMMKTLDVLFISIALGLGIGRIGCFFAGCCYGRKIMDATGAAVTSPDLAPWYAVKFPEGVNSLAQTGYYLFPSQLMDAGYNMLIFLALLIFRKKLQKHDGQAAWLFLLLYGILRSISEFYRGDDLNRGFVIPGYLSTSQAISIPIIIFALYMLIFYKSDKVTSRPKNHRAGG
jgi:phosphatidylglycerol---prolipoprotein diacylglyceryl transferase